MTGSLRLLLEDFLGLMREEGELDAFLPLLMSAMGHEVVYRAQKGPRQYGVDIVSVGTDGDGRRKLFLWLVKCGDIGRQDWNTGPQAIRQSIEDVGDTYLRSHVAPEHKRLRKKLLVVTNGDFKANINETIAGYLENWCSQKNVDAEQVNGSKLAAWTERHLLDEYILPSDSRVLLRRMLANVASPDLCVMVGRILIDQMLEGAVAPAKSQAAEIKKLLTGLRGMRTALQVLFMWSINEDNLLAAYTLNQYAVLATWAKLHQRLRAGDVKVSQEFNQLLGGMSVVAEIYHQKMDDYYVVQDAFANALPDSLLVSRTVFDELGKLGQLGCLLAFQAKESGNQDVRAGALNYANRVKALLQSHSCNALPAFDYQSANIHTALLLLVLAEERDTAKAWLSRLCQRLHYATVVRKFMPMSATFEDALAVRDGEEEMADEFCNTSTLLPILFIWTAALGMRDAYDFLRSEVLPRMKGTTPNLWSSETGFDYAVGSGQALHEHGVGESVMQFPEEPSEFLQAMSVRLAGIEGIQSSTWYQLRAPYIPLLAALHWQSQIPREMLVRQTVAFAGTTAAEISWPAANAC
ncbi:hypothetical protein [Candidatus Accumulibacter phosphatis]|uniref:Uncharacterized protein n=1 Tax=Candidatus Accumulibacter phosphatis TaxID=327160 RepID=A0A5S4EHZ0_9PROT|nr:hypothetical protein [Candidatus Accumulibacter phosphatis]TMQ74869.1 hypothetical protein ACCUM_2635 [Candidatus Accumulibacter phosphatis]